MCRSVLHWLTPCSIDPGSCTGQNCCELKAVCGPFIYIVCVCVCRK